MFQLRQIPFEACLPLLSKETIEFHYGKHHATYVNNLNNLIKDTSFAQSCLFEIIQKSDGGLFNNAAQVFNHDFYWSCIQEKQSNVEGDLKVALEKNFGSVEQFCEQFIQSAVTNFGSGWTWLVLDAGKLAIMNTSNADTPIRHNKVPLLVCDVWEHAYYIDSRNDRAKYVKSFMNQVNWQFVAECLKNGLEKGLDATKAYIATLHK